MLYQVSRQRMQVPYMASAEGNDMIMTTPI